ncbi:MAG: hypothetical protein M3418_03995 [Gemmatimonadota bacterium]|nr:hypothetical protein [Gemmatimonadota bacterium]
MTQRILFLLLLAVTTVPAATSAQYAPRPYRDGVRCDGTDRSLPHRNLTREELHCRYGVRGRGRFGLLSYANIPVYQSATPFPGTHIVGMAGLPGPRLAESFEEWESRVLRNSYGRDAQRVHSGVEVLDAAFALRIGSLETRLAQQGVTFSRRETWRAPERQEYLFQQGRSRPGPFATTTLTSWHSRTNANGMPAGRAVDYDVPRAQMPRFHEVVRSVGLDSFGADSNDPGHVFLPGEESVPPVEVALLRLLARVPVVTLATGRPYDEYLTRSRLREIRGQAREFVAQPLPGVDMARSRVNPLTPELMRGP